MAECPKPKRAKISRTEMHAVMPDEVWLKLLSYLDIKDISMMAATSQRYNILCRDSSLWKNLQFDWQSITVSLEGVENVIGKSTVVEKLKFTNDNRNKLNDNVLLSLVVKVKDTLKELVFSPDIILSRNSIQKLGCLKQVEKLILPAKKLNTAGVNSIAQLKTLKELRLERCDDVTHDDLSHLFKELNNLSILEVTNCSAVAVRPIGVLVRNNPNLEHINFSFCKFIGNAAVKKLTQNCLNLRYVNLMGTMVDKEGLDSLANCTNLQHLSLAAVTGLDDSCLLNIVNSCIKLRHLNLNRCRSLHKVAIENVLSSKKGLLSLNTSGIPGMSVKIVKKLRKDYPDVAIC